MKTYKLENLSCAHCAAEIEEALQKTKGVRSARVQFATLDLHLDADDLEAVKKVISGVEPEARVVGEETAEPARRSPAWIPLSVATAVLAALLAAESYGGFAGWPAVAVLAVLYVLAGWPVLKTAFLDVSRGRWFDENFLMAVATLAAWTVGAGAEAVSVMLFYQWGEYLQDRAVDRSRRSLSSLLAARPRSVRTLDGEQKPEDVATGTVFEVRAGEQVPLDGVVLEGTGSLDTSALTGESLPRSVEPGTEVAAGTLNLDAVLRLRSLRPFAESAWAHIVGSVDEALARKAPLERFLTRFARVYTPAVLLLALVLFGTLSLFDMPWHDSLYRSLVLLVISCPCALVVSIPLTYLGAIGAASRKGILVRDAGALDRLAGVRAVAFDKTGTLTLGSPRVLRLEPETAELRQLLDLGFASSSHPLARAWGKALAAPSAVETRGQGVLFTWHGLKAGIGRRSFLAQHFVGVPPTEDLETTVHAATEQGYVGRVEFEDAPKPETEQALAEVRALGLGPLALLSGDVKAAVETRGRQWAFDEARGGLLPQDKLAFVEAWENQGRRVLFVGDGMNDAPVLARSSVGVSLGAGASAAAIETADVAILDGSPRQVAALVRLGRRTRTLLFQNIALALGLKALFMVLGGLGLAGLWEAVFADVGVALLAVANSLRAGRALS